jgi:hypothetical protein
MSAVAARSGPSRARASSGLPPSSPCQDRLDRLGWVMGNRYRVHGVDIEIRTTSPRFATWMERTLGSHLAAGDPEVWYSVAVGDESLGSSSIHTLYRGIVPIVRSQRVSTLGRTLLAELDSFSYPRRADAVYLYATVVELDGLTVLIPSYLAPYIARSRRLIESMGIRMSAGPAVALDAGTGNLSPAVSRLEVPKGAASRLAGRDEQSAKEVVDVPSRRHADVVCWFSRGVKEPVRQISRSRALYELASDTANLGVLGGDALEALARLVRGARCFELRGDTPRSMLGALVDAVRAAPTERASG